MNDFETTLKGLTRGFATALGTDPNPTIAAFVRQGTGELPPNEAALVKWDTNSIHSFVFDSTNATGIRGASDVLRRVDQRLRNGKALRISREQILFVGGGSGLAVVPQAEVPSLSRSLHAFFADQTRVATCSVAAVPLIAGDENFGMRVQAVDRALSRKRLLKGSGAEPLVPFFAKRCEVCGRRAAAIEKPRGVDHTPRPECEPCHFRIEKGKQNVRFQNEPTDYEDIADSVRGGFIAVLYLDGNRMGRTLLKLTNPLDYSAFSLTLSQIFEKSFEEVAKRYGLQEETKGDKGSSYQLPICGGDDLVAILPGDAAIPFARDLLEEIQTAGDGDPVFERLEVEELGASAGIAIGHKKFPVRHLLSEAEALLESAKKRVYRDGARSALDFAVVDDGSPRIESVEPERWEPSEAGLLLSGRPYSLPEMQTLSSRFGVVRDAGRKIGQSQLFSLRRYGHAGPAQLRNHVLYQVGRTPGWRELINRLAKLESGVEDDGAARDKDTCLNQIAPNYGEFRILDVADMIELYDHWREPAEATP